MQQIKCNQCGSEDVIKFGHNIWKVIDPINHVRQRVQRWQCRNCGKIFTTNDSKPKEETKELKRR